MVLFFKQWPISIMPSTVSYGESCCKLLVLHKMTASFKEEEISKFCTCHKTFCTLSPPRPPIPSPPYPLLSASIGLKKLFHILEYRCNPAIKESPMRIVLKLLLFKRKQCLWCIWNHFAFNGRAKGIVVIKTDKFMLK